MSFMPEEAGELTRRGFLHRVILAVGAVITTLLGLPIVSYFLSPALKDNRIYLQLETRSRPHWLRAAVTTTGSQVGWTSVATLEEISPGKPVQKAYAWRKKEGWMVTSGRSSVWLVRQEGDRLTAFEPHCTHLGCPYSWDDARGAFFCPCHDGVFDINGNVVAGPPPRPLDRYEVKIEDGKVLIGRLIRGDETGQEV